MTDLEFMRSILSALLFLMAGFLALEEKEGWGWCLFIGLLLIP